LLVKLPLIIFCTTHSNRFFKICHRIKIIRKIFSLVSKVQALCIYYGRLFNAKYKFNFINILRNQKIKVLVLDIMLRKLVDVFIEYRSTVPNICSFFIINLKFTGLNCASLTPDWCNFWLFSFVYVWKSYLSNFFIILCFQSFV